MPQPTLDPTALYQQLGSLLATTPDYGRDGWATQEARLWLGRAAALVEAGGDIPDIGAIRVASDGLSSPRDAGPARTTAVRW